VRRDRTGARRIVDVRNRLTHEYPMVDDELVWALAKQDMLALRSECAVLIADLGTDEEADAQLA
jgi:uncharacterized protein with HEPN domain